MGKVDHESLRDRIAGMRFAVVLLAEVMEMQGLATHSEVCDMLHEGARDPASAATVARALAAISQRIEKLEERAAKEGRPALHIVRSDQLAGH